MTFSLSNQQEVGQFWIGDINGNGGWVNLGLAKTLRIKLALT